MKRWFWAERERWLYTLEHDFVWSSGTAFEQDWSCRDKNDVERLVIRRDGTFVVRADYGWDGCSPKYSIFDIALVGTPEGITNPKTLKCKTYYASLLHDALYQFMPEFKEAKVPITYHFANRMLLKLLQEADFDLSRFYFWAVETYGERYAKRTRIVRQNRGTVLPFNEQETRP